MTPFIELRLFQGSIRDLEVFLEEVGASTAALTVDGDWRYFFLGAPSFVNAAFAAAFPDGLVEPTPMIVAWPAGHPGPGATS